MSEYMSANLFQEFPPVTNEEWKEKIHKDLKGADFTKLIWKTSDGIDLEPFYRIDSLSRLNHIESLPGTFPYTRGYRKEGNNWSVREDFKVTDLKEANRNAIKSIEKGSSAIGFILSVPLSSSDIAELLNGIPVEKTEINLYSRHNAANLIHELKEFCTKSGIDKKNVKGSVLFDPIGSFSKDGKLSEEINGVSADLRRHVLQGIENFPGLRTIGIDGTLFRNAGASCVQEIAFSLAVGNEYISLLQSPEININNLAEVCQFNFSVGTEYFIEIAKLRAFRYLWSNILREQGNSDEIPESFIHSETSLYNMTLFDPYVNMLRATTESMSAILGGTDSLTVLPFDVTYKEPDEFSRRQARNIQLVLKEEAYLDKVADPAAGSYYIENLTWKLIEKAWQLFIEIEEQGGYIKAIEKQFIQKLIDAKEEENQKNLATRKKLLLGTNQFPNFTETMLDKITKSIDEASQGSDNMAIAPKRLSAEFDKLRIATEKSGLKPKVFMLAMGNLAMRRARSMFSCNFFGCAGFEVIDNIGFNTVEEGLAAYKKSKSNIIVLCSSDEEYMDLAMELAGKVDNLSKIVIAGYPAESIEDLKKIGIQHFIHVKSNVLDTLKGFQKILGII